MTNTTNPAHYKRGGLECIDVIEAATEGQTGIEAVCTANVIKYAFRWKEKGGVDDLRKARWYLDRLIAEQVQPDDWIEPGDGWIDWGGGMCPVPASVGVDYRLRGGNRTKEYFGLPAGHLAWQHGDCSTDIVAYRISKE